MAQLVLVVVIILGASALWFSDGQALLPGTSTTTSPVVVVQTVESFLDDIASTTAARNAEVLGETPVVSDIDPSLEHEEFPVRYPMTIGGVVVEASVATSVADRVRGLSGTQSLPPSVVKLFVFDRAGPQSIWMKDMLYSLDILWLDAEGVVVHLETDVRPDTFPKSFASPVLAWYVVEASAGFVASNGITIGATTTAARL